MSEIKLLPCPFCGTEPTMIVRKGKDGWRDRYAVLCDYEHGGCGAEGGWYHYTEEAAAAWNRRPGRPPSSRGGKIREMTDERLADFLQKVTLACYCCGKDGRIDTKPTHCLFGTCTGPAEMLAWVKGEADE